MFDIFIALFGSLFYGCQYLNEKSKSKEIDKQFSNWKDTVDNIRTKYVADYNTEQWAKNTTTNIRCFEDICNWFAEDLKYVFGDDWKRKIRLTAPFVDKYKPSCHEMWIYHLLLARKGKIDSTVVNIGLPVGGIDEKEMNIKFAERIEKQLIKAGVKDIRLVFELDDLCYGRRRTPADLCGGHIKIKSTCHYYTHRLWT